MHPNLKLPKLLSYDSRMDIIKRLTDFMVIFEYEYLELNLIVKIFCGTYLAIALLIPSHVRQRL